MKGVTVYLRARKRSRAPYLVVRARVAQLVNALGEPASAIEPDAVAYKIDGLRLRWLAGGALQVEGNPDLLFKFVDVLIERFRQFNSAIIIGVYRCRSSADWTRFQERVPEQFRLELLEQLVVRDDSQGMTIGQWSLLPALTEAVDS